MSAYASVQAAPCCPASLMPPHLPSHEKRSRLRLPQKMHKKRHLLFMASAYVRSNLLNIFFIIWSPELSTLFPFPHHPKYAACIWGWGIWSLPYATASPHWYVAGLLLLFHSPCLHSPVSLQTGKLLFERSCQIPWLLFSIRIIIPPSL